MNRNLHKMPRTVRKLDGALTAWRYFHGPDFVHEARDWRRRGLGVSYITENENMALFEVLYRFVKWMVS